MIKSKINKRIILYFLIFITFIYFVGANSNCTSDWDCTDWTPEKCPKNRIQERNCTDSNNCGNIKLPELKLCTYEADFSWLLKVIMGAIILIIIFIIRLIIKLLKNKKIS